MESKPPSHNAMKKVVAWLLLVAMLVIGCSFPYFILGGSGVLADDFRELYKEHFVAIIGLPLAAIVSLFIVFVLEQTQGPLEFDGLGFKFKGASGPVVLWVLCYLAITISLKTLW
jgi:hypothetical protein